jgi:hypothetical protein
MNCSARLLLLVAPAWFGGGAAAVAADAHRHDEEASQRFEYCLGLAARLPIQQAVGASCPVRREIRVPTESLPELTDESIGFVLRSLGIAGPADLCLESRERQDPAAAALCVLLSHEHQMWTRSQQRIRRYSDDTWSYPSVRLSVLGVGRYLRYTVKAAESAGFARLAQAVDATLRMPNVHDAARRAQLVALRQQADFLSRSLSDRDGAVLWRSIADRAYKTDRANPVERTWELMSEAAWLPSPGASPNAPFVDQTNAVVELPEDSETTALYSSLVEGWADDAARQYRTDFRQAVLASGISDRVDPFSVQVAESYAGKIMYDATARAGHCAIACVGKADGNAAVAVPMEIQSDLFLTMEISE